MSPSNKLARLFASKMDEIHAEFHDTSWSMECSDDTRDPTATLAYPGGVSVLVHCTHLGSRMSGDWSDETRRWPRGNVPLRLIFTYIPPADYPKRWTEGRRLPKTSSLYRRPSEQIALQVEERVLAPSIVMQNELDTRNTIRRQGNQEQEALHEAMGADYWAHTTGANKFAFGDCALGTICGDGQATPDGYNITLRHVPENVVVAIGHIVRKEYGRPASYALEPRAIPESAGTEDPISNGNDSS